MYRAELHDLAAAGCDYVQIDDTSFGFLCDEKFRASCRARGDDPAELPHLYARAVNAALAGRPAGMTTALHTCRGNWKRTWLPAGGYEPVAEVVFNEVDVDAFFLEYDTERAGSFEPLRLVPAGKRVVLGLVSTKTPALEDKGELQAPDRGGGEVRAAREPVPKPAVRLCEQSPRQRSRSRRPVAQACASGRSRGRGVGLVALSATKR